MMLLYNDVVDGWDLVGSCRRDVDDSENMYKQKVLGSVVTDKELYNNSFYFYYFFGKKVSEYVLKLNHNLISLKISDLDF